MYMPQNTRGSQRTNCVSWFLPYGSQILVMTRAFVQRTFSLVPGLPEGRLELVYKDGASDSEAENAARSLA